MVEKGEPTSASSGETAVQKAEHRQKTKRISGSLGCLGTELPQKWQASHSTLAWCGCDHHTELHGATSVRLGCNVASCQHCEKRHPGNKKCPQVRVKTFVDSQRMQSTPRGMGNRNKRITHHHALSQRVQLECVTLSPRQTLGNVANLAVLCLARKCQRVIGWLRALTKPVCILWQEEQ